uniref:Galectin domain-containing protein n=1 Tax=Globodera rostochiensis TaxID=31243 RepID=A0A914HUN5_GLORO
MIISATTLFLLAAFCSCFHQLSSNKHSHFYLSNPTQNYFETKYNAMDQCFSKEARRIFSFALKFKLHGKCRKGMLICYPGALDINGTKFSYGMAPGIQFRVKNEPGNDVAIKCAEKQHFECPRGSKEERKKYCLSGGVWHGIRLSKPSYTSDLFLLELSITNKTYQFNPNNEFSIEFGNQNNLITVLKDRLGNPIAFLHDEDNAICKAYLTRTAEKGVHLSNYVGLWMLGLDFLPINHRETLQLHVYRDCGCEMHAWFLTPNDNPAEVSYGVPSIPIECRPSAEQFELALNTPISNNKRITVMFRVNHNASDYVSIRLRNLKRDLVMLMKIRQDTIVLDSNLAPITRISLKRAGRNTLLKQFDQRYLQIDFVVRAYFYETRLNGIRLTRFFPWPDDWWLREGETEDVAYVELNGGLYPDSADTELLETKSLRNSLTESAHIDFGKPLCVGDSVIILGQINKDADRLYISLLHNAFEADTHLGTALLEIQLNFTDGGQKYLAKYQQWNEEEGVNHPQPFNEAQTKYLLQRGDAFEMRILLSSADKDVFKKHLVPSIPEIIVTLNTTKVNIELDRYILRSPLYISNIEVTGNLKLFKLPKIVTSKLKYANIRAQLLDPLLSVGDLAIFNGSLWANASELQIFFLHDSVDPEIKGTEIPMKIRFDFSTVHEENFMTFNSTVNNKQFDGYRLPSRLFAGEDFIIAISVEPTGYNILIHSAHVFFFNYTLPPWTVNCLRVDGNFKKLSAIKVIRGNAVITNPTKSGNETVYSGIQMPILLKVPNAKTFRPGNFISIRAKVREPENGTRFGINVTLLYNALENVDDQSPNQKEDKKGRVVMHLEFSKDAVKLSERYNKKAPEELSSHALNQTIHAEKLFELCICLHAQRMFSLHLNGSDAMNGSTTLPHWAIQYIRIDGNLIGNETFVKVHSGTNCCKMQNMNCLIIALLLSVFIFNVELKTNGSIEQTKPDFKQYARENWVDFDKEVQQFTKWLNRSDAHADEVIEVLLYISRLDEPIYVGVELLKALDGSEKLLKQIRKIAKSSSVDDHRSGSAVAFMFGTSGVVPLYVKVKSDEETMVEHLEMGKLIKHIVMSAQKHRSNRKRKLFHKIVEEVFADIKSVTKWSSDMLKRIVKWDESVKDRLQHLTLKKVAVGLKDVALWLASPAHVTDIVQIILYFTNLSGPIKISLEVISALGLDGTFTKIAAKMGVKLAENGVNRKVSMWMFGPNGVLPLFVRQGEKVDSEELMDTIDRANVWYYYKKEQIGANQLNIRCNLKILDEANEGGERSCAWKIRQKPEQSQEQLLEQMEEHMQSEHPVKYGHKLNAQREKEEIIRRADIWHYFQKDQQQIGYVNCKLHIAATERSGKVTQKCNWKIEIGKANESELNDHLSLEHLPEFEQRLKAMRKKELPIRHVHDDEPLTNSLTLFQRLTVSLVLYKGRPMDQLVDIVLERLHNWERFLLKKWKRRWERVKRIQFRDVREAFKHAAMWLITPKHINNVLKVIFIITKLDTPIFLTVEVLKAFGIQRHIVKKLDKASLKIKKRYEGTTLENSLLFMIGEGGVVRLFLDADSSVSVQDASANVKKNDLSLSGTAEFLHTVIMTVVNNQGSKAHALAFLVMDKLRDLRLELSLVRGWNSNWPQIEERYNKIKDELDAERIEKIGRESVRLNGEEFGDRPKPQQTEGESSDVSVEIGLNSFNSDESSYIDIAILTGSDSSDEHSVVFDNVLRHESEPIIMTGSDSSDEHSVVFDSVLHESEPSVDEHVQNTIPSPKMNGTSSNGKHDAFQLQQPKQKTKKHKSANGFKKLMGLYGIIVHKQSDEVYPQQQQQQSPLKESMASMLESDEQSVIVEQPDCPGKMEANHGHIQFADLLVRSDGDKCKTVQILSQKIKVVEDFLDEAIKTIRNAESEGDVPPVINLRLDNHIPLKKQKVLKKISTVNVMFLYYKMGQAGITFDCNTSDRPREYAFKGPKDKLFVLLLPACAEKSGKIGQFAIFRADYFDEVEIKIE